MFLIKKIVLIAEEGTFVAQYVHWVSKFSLERCPSFVDLPRRNPTKRKVTLLQQTSPCPLLPYLCYENDNDNVPGEYRALMPRVVLGD
jgi:hypothetical protein